MKKFLLIAGSLISSGLFSQYTNFGPTSISKIGQNNVQVNAQGIPEHRTCGTEAPSQQWEAWMQQGIQQYLQGNLAKLGINTTMAVSYTIPVIVHVIHGGQAIGTYPNISNAQVVSQINILTADFGGVGQYTSHYPATAFAAYATANSIPAPNYNGTRIVIGNAQLTFLPAYYNQSNQALVEPGVDRINFNSLPAPTGTNTSKDPANVAYNTPTKFMNFMNTYMKPNTIWNVTKYMNIWTTDENAAVGLLGFATFPPGTTLTGMIGGLGTNTTDGLWCWAKSYGNTGAALAPYNLGRTATHEIGHWVGLRHIWGDGTCLTDYCNDTPPASGANYVNQNTIATPSSPANGSTVNYPYAANSCPGPPANGSTGDMFMNFMDYSDDNAMYMFTDDQVTRIQTAMSQSPYRNALGTHGLTIPPPVANFSVSPSNTVCAGAVTLADMSTGSPQVPSAWSYTATGATTATSNLQNPVFTFTAVGVQTITLIATANGTANSLPVTKTISVISSPTVSVAPATPSICAGTSSSLTASGATTYSWSNGALTAGTTVTPAVTTVYTVTGTSGSCSTAKTVTVNVTAMPTVAVNSATICSGNAATLTASGAATYSWSTGALTSTISQSPAVTTVYTVTGANGTCTNAKTVTITVNTTPTVTANSATICSGNAVVLTGGGATTYSWSNGALTNTTSVSPVATAVYTVYGTTGSCTGAKTSTVTVKATPTLNISSYTICSGGSATLTASGATSYLWSNASTLNPIVVNPAVTTVYTATGTTNGCSGTKTATVTIGPNLSIVLNPASQTKCAGSSATVSASGATSYSWSNGSLTNSIVVTPSITATYTITGTSGACTGTNVATISVASVATLNIGTSNVACNGMANGSASITPTGGGAPYTYSYSNGAVTQNASGLASGNYTAIVTTSAGCVSSKTFAITQPAVLSINSNVANTSCGSCNGSISYTAAGGTPSYSYAVTPGGVNTNLCSGAYTVTTTDGNGCNLVTTFNVGASTALSATANSTGETCMGCADGSATVTVSGGAGPYSYTWSPAGGNAATASNLVAECYTVTIADGTNCVTSVTTCVNASSTTGIKTNNASAMFNIYPNPSNGYITVEFGSASNRTIEVMDVAGRLIQNEKASQATVQLNLSNYSDGVYYLKVKDQNGYHQFKLIKQ